MNPIPRYEKSLRRFVRFQAWFQTFDQEIQEVMGHYDDLRAEARERGMSDVEAAKYAESLLGNPRTVAGQMTRKTPKAKGFKLQWFAIILWVFFAISPLILGMRPREVGSIFYYFVESWDVFAQYSVLLSGILLAVGIFRAKTVSVAAIAVGVALIPASYWTERKVVTPDLRRVDRSAKKRYENIAFMRTEGRKTHLAAMKSLEKVINQPTEAGILEFRNVARQLEKTRFITPRNSAGVYMYPTGFQKVLPHRLPVIFFDRTNSLEIAQGNWRRATLLASVLPRMNLEAERSFESLDAIRYENMTFVSQIKSFTLNQYQQFGASTLVSIASLLGVMYAYRTLRPRRMAR